MSRFSFTGLSLLSLATWLACAENDSTSSAHALVGSAESGGAAASLAKGSGAAGVTGTSIPDNKEGTLSQQAWVARNPRLDLF